MIKIIQIILFKLLVSLIVISIIYGIRNKQKEKDDIEYKKNMDFLLKIRNIIIIIITIILLLLLLYFLFKNYNNLGYFSYRILYEALFELYSIIKNIFPVFIELLINILPIFIQLFKIIFCIIGFIFGIKCE
jgi:hypothetical protein